MIALAALPLAFAAFMPGLLLPSTAHAVTLGAYDVQSSLGQSLRMTIQVNARPDEEFDLSCFRVTPFSVASDGLPQLTGAQLRLDRRPGGEQRLLITSPRAIMDPIVRVALDVGCDTTLRREITLLLDPPSSIETLPQVAEARPSPVPIPSGGSGSSTNATGAAGGRGGGFATGTPSGSSGASPAGPGRGTAATVPGPARPTRPPGAESTTATPAGTPQVAQAEPRPPRPPRSLETASPRSSSSAVPPAPARASASRDRLTISASPLPLESQGGSLSPRLNLATSLSDRNRQALPETTMLSLRQKQARLRNAPAGEDLPSLEAEVVVLQKRTTEMQRQLDEVMSQMAALRAAGIGGGALSGSAPSTGSGPTVALSNPPAAARASGPAAANGPDAKVDRSLPWAAIWTDPRMIIAGPLAIVLLVLILGFVFWLRRERELQRRSDRWSYVPVSHDAVKAPVANEPDIDIAPGLDHTASAVVPVVTAAGTEGGPAGASKKPPQAEGYQFRTYSSGQAAQDLGVSDLAQATEKASVFVTLGRPAQAIDVLRDHIDHEPKSSPMAWLMLLDLYRQTDRYEDFSGIAQRFHLEFNAVTPEWSHPVAALHDVGLGAFPYLIARIRDSWPTEAAKSFLEDLLYDNRGGSRIGFSIPAFRDLLLLHSMVDEHLHAVATAGTLDSATGRVVSAAEAPTPPEHLAGIWNTASPERPVYTTPLPDPDDAGDPEVIAMPFFAQEAPGSSAAPGSIYPIPPLSPGSSRVSSAASGLSGTSGLSGPAIAAAAANEYGALNMPAPQKPAPQEVTTVPEPIPGSALEKSYPIIAEAIVKRWGQPGLASYLSNLIRSSTDHGAGLTNEALAELILLHDIALDLGEPEPMMTLM